MLAMNVNDDAVLSGCPCRLLVFREQVHSWKPIRTAIAVVSGSHSSLDKNTRLLPSGSQGTSPNFTQPCFS